MVVVRTILLDLILSILFIRMLAVYEKVLSRFSCMFLVASHKTVKVIDNTYNNIRFEPEPEHIT